MRRNFALTPVFIAIVFAATLGHAQSAVLDLPRDSQHAKIIQRVGITDITINYHRPLVKGRKVWGRTSGRLSRTRGISSWRRATASRRRAACRMTITG